MFYDYAKVACSRKNTTLSATIKELGLSSGCISSWKRGSSPSADLVYSMAKHLGVSMEFLMSGVESVQSFTDSEINLISMYRELPVVKQEFILDAIQTAYDKEISLRASQEKLSV